MRTNTMHPREVIPADASVTTLEGPEALLTALEPEADNGYDQQQAVGLDAACDALRAAYSDLDPDKIIDDPTEAFIYAAAQVPRLDASQERALGGRALAGDAAAQRALVEANLMLAVAIANEYAPQHTDIDDLLQVGGMALMRAAQTFDASRNFRFSTYAAWWVRGMISYAAGFKDRLVHMQHHIDNQASQLARVSRGLLAENGAEPTDEALADGMGIPVEQVRTLRAALVARKVASLDVPADPTNEESSLQSQLAADSDNRLAMIEFRDQIEHIIEISGITPKQAEVMRLVYLTEDGKPRTNQAVASMLGKSHEAVGRQRYVAEVVMRLAARKHKLQFVI